MTRVANQAEPTRVVILGGGFGGLHAAQSLRNAPVQVTLIDRANYHLFQPLLYQVATGSLSPANIAAPLRSVLRRQKNVTVLQAEVTDFDLDAKRVLLREGDSLPYDVLIVAAGATHSYFGHNEWEGLAPGLKTIEDATQIRADVLSAFERAERTDDPVARARLLTFVVVGGGPTGVELAGALSELSRHALKNDFRRIESESARIVLIDAGDRVLSGFAEELSAKAAGFLDRLDVSVRTGWLVTEITPTEVTIRHGEQTETLATETVLWAAGVLASPLANRLADATGLTVDRAGRLAVTPTLHLPGHEDIFVIGDMASCAGEAGRPLPGVAPVAIQQGQYAAKTIRRRLAAAAAGSIAKPFRYRDYGSMATVGRSAAVASIGGYHFAGYVAWLIWLFVHLMQLVSFQNRLLVLFQWAWNYVTHGRSARLITGNRHAETPAE
ncbi:NADH dehydrogenase-like protein [Botrimarina colliarenosi]|uniref:NADH:ubiquinone reductase (non-electrogenic) n=1 Tax=Botrimarina colliarenosi TaxID=2528001 RepID=A0A5C6AIA6_9BACT|nr:NAD(P)/FAD-dependent oxidoreductase [Botrimarina colliarenosi]TWT99150.1 NADH dehydrogenase-like protein [Botrimarina colliarenosi]